MQSLDTLPNVYDIRYVNLEPGAHRSIAPAARMTGIALEVA
jgi:hypothetical protein